MAFTCADVGLVTAQEAELPPIPPPPDESAAEPVPPVEPAAPPTPDEGELRPPAEPPEATPYTVLGPDAQRAQAEAPPPPPVLEEPEVEEEEAEVEPVEPPPPPPLPRRPRHSAAILQAVDKVTAETIRFEVDARRPVRWKSLVFRVNGCETEALNEPLKESAAHLSITSEPRAQPGRRAPEPAQVFRGWMFASAPGLNPFEHPVYDAWLVGCRVPAPAAAPVQGGAEPPVQGGARPPAPRAAPGAVALRPAASPTGPG